MHSERKFIYKHLSNIIETSRQETINTHQGRLPEWENFLPEMPVINDDVIHI